MRSYEKVGVKSLLYEHYGEKIDVYEICGLYPRRIPNSSHGQDLSL